MKKKILLVTFSDNADHQDTLFGMYENLLGEQDVYLLAIKEPKVEVKKCETTWLVDCPKRPGICKKTFDLKLLFSLIKRVRKEKFDVIYFESLHVWNLPIMILSSKNTHTFQVVHEVIPHEGDKQVKMVDLMNKAVCLFCDTIVLRNQMYIDEMVKRYHISKDRIRYSELWRRYPEYTEPTYSKRVLFFGRINPYKGADNLIDLARMCPDIQFDVVGRVDAQMEEVMAELSKEKNVLINNDYVSDEEMKNYFINADWIIVPYNSASQSGIIIDAYKYSRPVIAFNVGAISEQVSDGESGYLIAAGDKQKFAEKLREVVAMPKSQFEEMCKDAYYYGSQKYAASGARERFMELVK